MTVILEARGVSVDYGRGRHRTTALDAADLAIHAGESVGIVGESGSGKTTLARALVGLVLPSAGRSCWAACRCIGGVPAHRSDRCRWSTRIRARR